MREITFVQAMIEALREEMSKDERVLILAGTGAKSGGYWGDTVGLYQEFGPDRVKDTPVSEEAIAGFGVGLARMGMRPVADISVNWIFHALDQIVNHAAKYRYMSGGKVTMPVVFRTTSQAGPTAGAQHSQTLDAMFMHFPGLKIVVPATPYDVKGLMKASIRDDNPVIFSLHIELYPLRGPVPEEEYLVALGKADVKREGNDVTVVSVGAMVHHALKAAEELSQEGVSVEVIDLRSLCPLDNETIMASVRKTGRLIIAERGCKTNGIGAEIAARVAEEALPYLKTPIERVAAADTPVPCAKVLVDQVLPGKGAIIKGVKEILCS